MWAPVAFAIDFKARTGLRPGMFYNTRCTRVYIQKCNTYLDVQTKVDGKKGLKFVRDTMKALTVLGKGGQEIGRRMLEVRSPMYFFPFFPGVVSHVRTFIPHPNLFFGGEQINALHGYSFCGLTYKANIEQRTKITQTDFGYG